MSLRLEDDLVILNGEASRVDAVVQDLPPPSPPRPWEWLFGSPSLREQALGKRVKELELTLEATEDRLALKDLELEAMALMHERLVNLLRANQLVAAKLVDELTGGGAAKQEAQR